MRFLAVKITGCILLVLATTLTGFTKAYRLYRRRDTLVGFTGFLTALSTNIRYNSSDIFCVIELCKDSFSQILVKYLRESEGAFSDRWKIAVNNLPKSCSLNKKDKDIISSFGEKLGVTDVQGQIEHIEHYQILAETQLQNAEKEISDKSKLYRTMGFFAGTAVALVLI